jgi:RNA polymerase primary sigma factor
MDLRTRAPRRQRARRATAGPTATVRGERTRALLTAEQERTYAGRIAGGDREARDAMVRANLGLVTVIARYFAGNGLDLEDLIGAGHIGLITAAERFDPRFNTRFSTYAGPWIKQAIREALGNTGAMIRLPMHAVGLLGRWRRTAGRLGGVLGREPGFDEVAGALGLPEGKRRIIEQALRTRRRADPVEGAWEPAAAPVEPLADEERAEQREDLGYRLGRLDATERSIIALRYGLSGEGPMTLKEVGSRVGFTREWVRKLEIRALAKLR